MENENNRKTVLEILKSKIFKQDVSEELKRLALQYYDKYCIKYEQGQENPISIPPPPKQSEFHNIDIKDLEKHSFPDTQHTVVIDAGIATDDNLEELDRKGYRYVCVSKERIKDYQICYFQNG